MDGLSLHRSLFSVHSLFCLPHTTLHSLSPVVTVCCSRFPGPDAGLSAFDISFAADMAKPAQTSLTLQGEHAGDVCTLNDIPIWCVFLPGGAKFASEASEMETIEAFFLFCICCPRFATIEEGA